jgi:hypothetical protein
MMKGDEENTKKVYKAAKIKKFKSRNKNQEGPPSHFQLLSCSSKWSEKGSLGAPETNSYCMTWQPSYLSTIDYP